MRVYGSNLRGIQLRERNFSRFIRIVFPINKDAKIIDVGAHRVRTHLFVQRIFVYKKKKKKKLRSKKLRSRFKRRKLLGRFLSHTFFPLIIELVTQFEIKWKYLCFATNRINSCISNITRLLLLDLATDSPRFFLGEKKKIAKEEI